MNPTSGTPRIARADAAEADAELFEEIAARLISSGGFQCGGMRQVAGAGSMGVSFVFVHGEFR